MLGVAHVGDMKAVGRIGIKALIYFEVVTTFALIFGLVIGNIVKPGAGFDVNPETLATGADAVAKKTSNGELPRTVEFLLNIIPTSAISAFTENELLQVLFFAVLFGLALAKIGEKAPFLAGFVDRSSHVFFTMIGWIMKLAPLGAFGAMAYIIGQSGSRGVRGPSRDALCQPAIRSTSTARPSICGSACCSSHSRWACTSASASSSPRCWC